MANPYTRIARLRGAEDFRAYTEKLNIHLPFDEIVDVGPDAPLASKLRLQNNKVIGNRFCILPMEGWDGTMEGMPTEMTQRRWNNFGRSGAKKIWGGEAVAVRHDGRANHNQLMIQEFLHAPGSRSLQSTGLAA
jgi:NADPH2 dehydrogenase